MDQMLKTFDYTSHAYDDTLFNELRSRDSLVCVGHKRFKGKTEPAALLELGELLNYSVNEGSRETFIIKLGDDGSLAKINIGGTSASHRVSVATRNMEQVGKYMARFSDLFEEIEVDETTVPVTFWYNGPHGASSRSRNIKVATWSDIRGNYNTGVAESLDELMKYDAQSENGLILWTGDPGTGKTTAIRALAQAWKPWCNVAVITDPEVFLNNISYLNDVMFEEEEIYVEGEFITGEAKPTLLILEDAGELITADAKEATGQALSRLLNVADGLLGQGVQLYILITTNEYVHNLNPAIQRNGRAISTVDFVSLSAAESNEWLKSHGCTKTVNSKTSVADLYAILRGKERTDVKKKMPLGFAAHLED